MILTWTLIPIKIVSLTLIQLNLANSLNDSTLLFKFHRNSNFRRDTIEIYSLLFRLDSLGILIFITTVLVSFFHSITLEPDSLYFGDAVKRPIYDIL